MSEPVRAVLAIGGNLGKLAEKNGWAGIVVNGCVRDSAELNDCEVGIRALATHPRRSIRKGVGEKDLAVDIAGVTVRPGDWIYADEDGVLVRAATELGSGYWVLSYGCTQREFRTREAAIQWAETANWQII